jgi:hypothetical protein
VHTVTFYEEMVAAEKQHGAELEIFQRRCATFVPWLLEKIRVSLGWPAEQFKRLPPVERPPGSHPNANGYANDKGYTFAFQIDMWGRWSADFRWSIIACNGEHITLSVGDRLLSVIDQHGESLAEIVRHVMDAVTRTCREANLVGLTSTKTGDPTEAATPRVQSSAVDAANGA